MLNEFKKYVVRTTPRWSKLQRVGNSKLVLTSYLWIILIPIFAKFIPLMEVTTIKLCQYINQIGIECNSGADFYLPFTWQLFYYGSVLFAISGLIYKFKCPFINVKYDNPIEAEKQGYGLVQLTKYLKNHYHSSNKEDELKKYNAIPIDSSEFKNKYWFLYKLFSSNKFFSRLCCSLGYYLGFLLYLIVLGQNFYSVLKQSNIWNC